MMNWDRIERWDYVVEAVASEYHRKFSICEYEDIKQALYKWFIEHPNKLDTWEAIGEKDANNPKLHYVDYDRLDSWHPSHQLLPMYLTY